MGQPTAQDLEKGHRSLEPQESIFPDEEPSRYSCVPVASAASMSRPRQIPSKYVAGSQIPSSLVHSQSPKHQRTTSAATRDSGIEVRSPAVATPVGDLKSTSSTSQTPTSLSEYTAPEQAFPVPNDTLPPHQPQISQVAISPGLASSNTASGSDLQKQATPAARSVQPVLADGITHRPAAHTLPTASHKAYPHSCSGNSQSYWENSKRSVPRIASFDPAPPPNEVHFVQNHRPPISMAVSKAPSSHPQLRARAPVKRIVSQPTSPDKHRVSESSRSPSSIIAAPRVSPPTPSDNHSMMATSGSAQQSPWSSRSPPRSHYQQSGTSSQACLSRKSNSQIPPLPGSVVSYRGVVPTYAGSRESSPRPLPQRFRDGFSARLRHQRPGHHHTDISKPWRPSNFIANSVHPRVVEFSLAPRSSPDLRLRQHAPDGPSLVIPRIWDNRSARKRRPSSASGDEMVTIKRWASYSVKKQNDVIEPGRLCVMNPDPLARSDSSSSENSAWQRSTHTTMPKIATSLSDVPREEKEDIGAIADALPKTGLETGLDHCEELTHVLRSCASDPSFPLADKYSRYDIYHSQHWWERANHSANIYRKTSANGISHIPFNSFEPPVVPRQVLRMDRAVLDLRHSWARTSTKVAELSKEQQARADQIAEDSWNNFKEETVFARRIQPPTRIASKLISRKLRGNLPERDERVLAPRHARIRSLSDPLPLWEHGKYSDAFFRHTSDNKANSSSRVILRPQRLAPTINRSWYDSWPNSWLGSQHGRTAGEPFSSRTRPQTPLPYSSTYITVQEHVAADHDDAAYLPDDSPAEVYDFYVKRERERLRAMEQDAITEKEKTRGKGKIFRLCLRIRERFSKDGRAAARYKRGETERKKLEQDSKRFQRLSQSKTSLLSLVGRRPHHEEQLSQPAVLVDDADESVDDDGPIRRFNPVLEQRLRRNEAMSGHTRLFFSARKQREIREGQRFWWPAQGGVNRHYPRDRARGKRLIGANF